MQPDKPESKSRKKSWMNAVIFQNAVTGASPPPPPHTQTHMHSADAKYKMCSVFKWEIASVLGVHITALSRRGPCLFFLHGVCFCRCCVTETIPASYLEQVRHKYLNYDTRAQRKDFLLQCTDPRSRYTPNAFVVFAMVAFSWFPCICAYVLVSVSLCSVCVCVCHKH